MNRKISYYLALLVVGLIICGSVVLLINEYTKARSVILKPGVVLKNNVSIRSGIIDQRSGSLSTTTQDYSKELGGVDDYNDGGSMPGDSFSENFTQCTSANNYCGTNDATACAGDVCYRDDRTNLIWSDRVDADTHTWFWANNCEYSGVSTDCDVDGEVGCQCVKLTSSKTGCEAIGDGNWRLPHQKELMQVYINGSWGNLPHAGIYYWSATTQSYGTHYAWYTHLHYGLTYPYTKTNSRYVRCVR